MFCPNCGANNSTEQKFCRSCGLNLEQIALSLLEQIPSAESAKILRNSQKLERFGNVAFGGFAVVILMAVCAIIYLIITKVILSGNSVFGGILLIAFIVFAMLTLAYVILKEDLEAKTEKINPAMNNDQLASKRDTAKLLEDKAPEPISPVASVTENPTELLYTQNKTSKL